MSMSSVSVTGAAVVALTAAGKQGTGWLDENDLGAVGQVDVRVYHTDGAAPSVATVKLLGKRMYRPINNYDVIRVWLSMFYPFDTVFKIELSPRVIIRFAKCWEMNF